MHTFLPYVIAGLVTGAVYGLAATGLVLTYKTSGIFNFAYGSVAAMGVFVFYWLNVDKGLPWGLAAAICVLVLAPLEGLLLELLGRALERQGSAVKIVATVGLLLIVLGIGGLWYGSTNGATVPQYLPNSSFILGGVHVTWAQVIVFAVAVLGAAGLYWFFRSFRLGMAMRGIVDDPELLDLTGENPTSVRRWAWIIGTIFATIAGLLISPSLGLDATVITLLVVQAFGAAAIGYFSSLPLAFVGGLVVGLLTSFGAKYSVDVSWLSGLPGGIPFIVLFLVLIFMPARLLADRRPRQALPVRRVWNAPPRIRLIAGVLTLAAFLLIPPAAGWNIIVWTSAVILIPLFLSVGLLARTSGLISLCQYTFAAIGAAAFGHFAGEWHIPWLVAVLLSAAVAVPVGAFVAIPAIRLSGVFLAVATLGLAIFVGNVVFPTNWMFGVTSSGLHTPQPDVSIAGIHLNSTNGFYYLVVVFALAATILVIAIERSRMGRMLRALGDSPTILEVQGLNVNVTLTVVFCISAAMAGVVGVLMGAQYQYATADQFQWFQSVQVVALVIIVIGGTPWYALMAAAAQGLISGYATSPNVADWLSIAFGAGAIAYVYGNRRGGGVAVPQGLRDVLVRLDGRLAAIGPRPKAPTPSATDHLPVAGPDRAETPMRPTAALPTGPGLEARQITVNFGGVRALNDVSLTAGTGQVTGLIGPNGAGKTTLFNCCSGLMRPTSGRVFFDGEDITSLSRPSRAQRGLGRTFQRTQLFDSLTVEENIAVGREAGLAGSNPLRQLASRRVEDSTVRDSTAEAMSLVGIEDLADQQAGLLTTGQRRLVELARVLAGSFSLVMLDEPSAGLDSDETAEMGEILRQVVDRRGLGILIVEHDLSLVRQICERIYVLEFGQLIFEGTPDQMMTSEVVRVAYLGEDFGTEMVTEEAGDRLRQ
jgi:ABC-type branched-subunit amino acid transport system ATPase component/branched-subunit amino acid ABC-type transport system permease component